MTTLFFTSLGGLIAVFTLKHFEVRNSSYLFLPTLRRKLDDKLNELREHTIRHVRRWFIWSRNWMRNTVHHGKTRVADWLRHLADYLEK